MKTILTTIIGSRAYGLDTPKSDWDRRAIFVHRTEDLVRLVAPADVFQVGEDVSFELRKFLKLASDGNPNVLEFLFSEYAKAETEEGRLLMENRQRLLSKQMVAKYVGFARGVFAKDATPKEKMHAFRLLYTCTRALREGKLDIRVIGYKMFLASVRAGEFDDQRLQAEFERALESVQREEKTSPLPDEPDYPWIDEFLLYCRKANL